MGKFFTTEAEWVLAIPSMPGMVIVADGTKERDERLERVLTVDPGIGIARHVDAGYEEAIQVAKQKGVLIPE